MSALTKKIIFLSIFLFATVLSANIAKVVALKGDATILREGKNLSLTKKSIILKHDEIKTKNKSKVQLLFKDNTVISIGGNSSFQVYNYIFDEKNQNYEAGFSMIKGTFRTITGKIGKFAPSKFNLKTKSASIGIRGTQIVMNLSKNQEQIFCTEGKIFLTKKGINFSSIINAGEFVALNNSDNNFEVKKIKESDIKKINKNVEIKDNLAIDNITIEEEKKNFNIKSSLNDKQETKINNSNISFLNIENENEILEPTLPEPTIPEPTIPEPTLPEPTIPEPTIPEPTLPKPTIPEPTIPEPTIPEPTIPEPTIPEPTIPEPTIPEPTIPEPTIPEPTIPEPTLPEPTLPEPTIPEPTLPEPTIPEPTLPEPTLPEPIDDLSEFTPESYFENNNSIATYKGDFNSYSFNNGKQYMKDINNNKVAIPNDTSISMTIDFGKEDDHISDGEIVISDVGDSTSRTLTFDGEIEDDGEIELDTTGTTKGSGGSGNFFGSEAELLKGKVNMKSSDNIQIKGNFDANKQ